MVTQIVVLLYIILHQRYNVPSFCSFVRSFYCIHFLFYSFLLFTVEANHSFIHSFSRTVTVIVVPYTRICIMMRADDDDNDDDNNVEENENDSNSNSNTQQQQQQQQLLLINTQQAINNNTFSREQQTNAAFLLQHSDSVLSMSSSDDDIDNHNNEQQHQQQQEQSQDTAAAAATAAHQRLLSVQYMEEASMETSLWQPPESSNNTTTTRMQQQEQQQRQQPQPSSAIDTQQQQQQTEETETEAKSQQQQHEASSSSVVVAAAAAAAAASTTTTTTSSDAWTIKLQPAGRMGRRYTETSESEMIRHTTTNNNNNNNNNHHHHHHGPTANNSMTSSTSDHQQQQEQQDEELWNSSLLSLEYNNNNDDDDDDNNNNNENDWMLQEDESERGTFQTTLPRRSFLTTTSSSSRSSIGNDAATAVAAATDAVRMGEGAEESFSSSLDYDLVSSSEESIHNNNNTTACSILQAHGILETSTTATTTTTVDDVVALQQVFAYFCVPTVPVKAIQMILQQEKQSDTNNNSSSSSSRVNVPKNVPLPDPVTIVVQHGYSNKERENNHDKKKTKRPISKVVSLLQASDNSNKQALLFQLPRYFSKAFLRILIRLLSHESDDEYHRQVAYCERELPSLATEKERVIDALNVPTTTTAPDPDHATRRPHILYNVARFQCTWWNTAAAAATAKDGDDNNDDDADVIPNDKRPAILSLLTLLESAIAMTSSSSAAATTTTKTKADDDLIPPLARLLGLLCVAGITPHILRRMMQLAQTLSVPPTARLALLGALKTAAAGSARSFVLKSPPRHFFCFSGTGLQRTLTGLASWPFRNDFGMALWFRAERFMHSSSSSSDNHNNNTASSDPILLSARSDDGGGIVVSLARIENAVSEACTIVVSIYDSSEQHHQHRRGGISHTSSPVHQLTVRGCVLLPRVWYHIAIRHTRSRLKGVFSLSMRQQLSIMLDGKIMLTESLAFPKILESDFRQEASSLLGSTLRRSISSHSRLNLNLLVGDNGFDGETGAIYIFNDSVSDATFRALYETTGGRHRALRRRPSTGNDVWDAKRSDIVRKSRILDTKITTDDADEIVLSHRRSGAKRRLVSEKCVVVMDVDTGGEETETSELPTDLSRAAFASKVFISFDPKRVLASLGLELQAGAHVNLGAVNSWSVDGAQDVIKNLGGIQALIPIFHSFLSAEGEQSISKALPGYFDKKSEENLTIYPVSGALPILLDMLSCFVKDNNKNSRELLRCGGIDIIADLLAGSKRLYSAKKSKFSLFGAVSSCSGLSSRLVESLIRLEASCTPYVALETKVFSRLLFNVHLWLDGSTRADGQALQAVLYPVLSEITRYNPERVRDCVGVKDLVHALREISVETKGTGNDSSPASISPEKLKLAELILGMIFTVFGSGTRPEHFAPFLHFASSCLDSSRFEPIEDAHVGLVGQREITIRCCLVLVFLLQIRPSVSGLIESFADCCGSVQGGAAWILCAMVNVNDEQIRSLGVRCIASYAEVTSHGGADAVLSLGSSLPIDKKLDHPMTTDVATNVIRASNKIGRLAKGLASIGPSNRVGILSSSKLTARVVYKLLWHFLKVHRYHLSDYTHTALLSLITDDNGVVSSTLSDYGHLRTHLLCPVESTQKGFRLCYEWAEEKLSKSIDLVGKSFRNPLALGTVLRLLRFFEGDQKEKWLDNLLVLCHSNRKGLSILASLPEWQTSLFQLISDTLELVKSGPKLENRESTVVEGNDGNLNDVLKRLDVCLHLYSTLLGHLLRDGGEKVRFLFEMGNIAVFALSQPHYTSHITIDSRRC